MSRPCFFPTRQPALPYTLWRYRVSIFFGLPPSLLHLQTYLAALASAPAHSVSTLILSGNTPIERFILRYPTLYHASWHQSVPFILRHRQLARQHLHCATAEIAFRAGESYPGFPDAEDILQQLATQKAVTYRATAKAWGILEPQPHRYVRLRTYEPAWTWCMQRMSRFLPASRSPGFSRMFSGGYLYGYDRTLHVERCLPERRRIVAKPMHAEYMTRGLISTAVQNKTITASVTEDDLQIKHGMVEYTEKLSAYERLHPHTLQRQSVHLLPAVTTASSHARDVDDAFGTTASMPLPDLQTAAHTFVHAVLAGLPLLCVHHHR